MLRGLRFDREFRRVALLTVSLWLLIWGFWAVGELLSGRTAFIGEAWLDLPVTSAKAAVAVSLYPLCLASRSWPSTRRWIMLLGAIVVIAALQSLLEWGEVELLELRARQPLAYWPSSTARFAASLLNNGYLSFGTAALLAFQVEARCSAEQRIALARAEAAAERARLAALRLQLNPHFLFNTLNAVSSLVVTKRNADAEEMLTRLSGFLRNSLAADPDAQVTLDQEAETIETYLEIEQVRFGDRMQIAIDYPAALGDVLVPGFILQPLAENAVKYGVSRTRAVVTVTVTAERHNDILELIVRDDGAVAPLAEPTHGLGVGLANIKQRLHALYGRRGSLETSASDEGFTARIRLPLTR